MKIKYLVMMIAIVFSLVGVSYAKKNDNQFQKREVSVLKEINANNRMIKEMKITISKKYRKLKTRIVSLRSKNESLTIEQLETIKRCLQIFKAQNNTISVSASNYKKQFADIRKTIKKDKNKAVNNLAQGLLKAQKQQIDAMKNILKDLSVLDNI